MTPRFGSKRSPRPWTPTRGRLKSGETAACDLREGMEATFKLIRHRLDGVTIHRDFATDRLAKAPAGPMNQVLLNLVDNALRMGARNLWFSVTDRGKCHRRQGRRRRSRGDETKKRTGSSIRSSPTDRRGMGPVSVSSCLGRWSKRREGRFESRKEPGEARCSSWWFLRYPWDRSLGGRQSKLRSE